MYSTPIVITCIQYMYCNTYFEDHMEEHVESCLSRVFARHVGRGEVEEVGSRFGAYRVHQTLLTSTSWTSYHYRLYVRSFLMCCL